MKVAMVVPEFYGVAMTGGLAMASSGLARALQSKGADVRVIMPAYKGRNFQNEEAKATGSFSVSSTEVSGIRVHRLEGLVLGNPYTYVYARDVAFNGPNFTPDITYAAYKDEGKRAFTAGALIAVAVPRTLEYLEKECSWTPDVVHLHEWSTAAASHDLSQTKFASVPVVVTSHNARYCGPVPFDPPTMEDIPTDSPIAARNTASIRVGDEVFTSLLEMGVFYADAVTTVSPTYRQEIIEGNTPMDGRVARRMREKEIVGILNGIDGQLMDPAHDPHIIAFDPTDLESVAYGKGANKQYLQSAYRINSGSTAMQISMLSRLVEQKGIDVVLKAIPEIEKMGDVRLLIFGVSPERDIQEQVGRLSGNVVGINYFAAPKAQHQVLAGSDAILMPSRWEPCGYTQLEGMRYGAIPITTHVGGLKDTVQPFDGTDGYGFVIDELTPAGLVQAITAAREAFKARDRWRVAVANALKADFTWEGPQDSVGKYLAMYEGLRAEPKPSQ